MTHARVLARKVATGKPGDNPYALLIGAGSSVSSGIPSASAMITAWKQQISRDECVREADPRPEDEAKWLAERYQEWLDDWPDPAESEYGKLFSHFCQHAAERQRHIEELIDGKVPTFGYLYLAGLIAAERFNRILTTNFDDLIADALLLYYGTRPITCAFDSAIGSIRMASRRSKIVKLHGDFLFDTMRNMGPETKRLGPIMQEKLFEACKDSGLIVIGYGGNDESIMAPLHQILHKGDHLKLGLHWCVQVTDPSQPPELSDKLKSLVRHYGDQVHLYEILDFDTLMLMFFSECRCELPKAFMEPQTSSVFQEFRRAVENTTSYFRDSRMQEHMALFMSRSRQQIDMNEIYVGDANDFHRAGNEELNSMHADLERGAAEDAKEAAKRAERLFLKSLDVVNAVLLDPAVAFTIRAKALKRKSGALSGLIESSQVTQDGKWRCWFEDTIQCVEAGIELQQMPEGTKIEIPVRRTFFYNGCCAIGSLVIGDGRLSPERTKDLHRYLCGIRGLDPEREDWNLLRKEKCFRLLKELLDQELTDLSTFLMRAAALMDRLSSSVTMVGAYGAAGESERSTFKGFPLEKTDGGDFGGVDAPSERDV